MDFRAQSHKEAEFKRGALSHLDALYALASRLTRSPSEADDLVQDTFVQAMRAREQFTVGTNLRAWLSRILTNLFLSKYRHRVYERRLTDTTDVDPVSEGWVSSAAMRQLRDPEQVALAPLVEAELGQALGELPDDYRVAVLLSDVEGLTYDEIAETVGCPVGTVMSRLHRGRKILQGKLVEHAAAIGIVTHKAHERTAPAGEGGQHAQPVPTSLVEYRARKRKTA